jgi:hypothetical protein
LVRYEPCTLRARTDDDQQPLLGYKEDSYITVPPSGLAKEDVHNHHGLYWNLDGVLEEPQSKMYFAHGHLKPEYVNNFATPLDCTMSISPLINWKIIARESNDNSQIKLDLQFKKNGNRTISGSRWTQDTTYIEILQFY